MDGITQYNGYVYRPHRKGHNVFTPEELAYLRELDQRVIALTARERRNQRNYYQRNKAQILARNKAYLERRKADHADKEATP